MLRNYKGNHYLGHGMPCLYQFIRCHNSNNRKIAKNISFEQLASFFAGICKELIIEFVPKNDPKVIGMLQWRKDIFDDYSEEKFQKAFEDLFMLKKKVPVPGSERTMFVYQKK
jgi:hypothetical protein